MSPGDWVKVWGQVVDAPHPDDLTVEFFSHNEQWRGVVEKVRCEPAPSDATNPFARRCTALARDTLGVGFAVLFGESQAFVRCVRHERHSDLHRAHHGQTFGSADVVGYIEEKA